MSVPSSSNDLHTKHRRRRFPRWLPWAAGGLALVAAVAAAVVAYVVHNAEPILRRRVIASLQDRFQSPVELDALHISVLKGLEVSGSGLRILRIAGPDHPDMQPQGAPPMLAVRSFEFHTGLRQLFEPTMRVMVVRVDGMQLNIPPRSERGRLTPRPGSKPQSKWSIVLGEIDVRDVTLTIETDKPGKQPLVFDIRNVTLHDVGRDQAFPFEAWLVNAKPVGDIHSTGSFGPWQGGEPRDTPVSGEFSFTHADLNTIKGLGGMLSANGTYRGTLGEIGATGTTDTPDFSLDVSGHPVDLKTQFDATVDGTTGDTRLNSVHATLLHTVLQVSGMVKRVDPEKGQGGSGGTYPGTGRGHDIDLTVVSNQARVEDLLTVAAKTVPPLMHGALTLRARLEIPPGPVSVSQKMRLAGTFSIAGATFTNPHWQQTVDKLSERAKGNPEQANAENAERVQSDMRGTFTMEAATLNVAQLDYRMPGAQVDLAGRYSLDGNLFDFEGTARTKATASQMLTGWKSLLAKPLDPLLKKDGAGVEVPIKIDGTKSDPKFGVDLGKLGAQIFARHSSKGTPEGPVQAAPDSKDPGKKH